MINDLQEKIFSKFIEMKIASLVDHLFNHKITLQWKNYSARNKITDKNQAIKAYTISYVSGINKN